MSRRRYEGSSVSEKCKRADSTRGVKEIDSHSPFDT